MLSGMQTQIYPVGVGMVTAHLVHVGTYKRRGFGVPSFGAMVSHWFCHLVTCAVPSCLFEQEENEQRTNMVIG